MTDYSDYGIKQDNPLVVKGRAGSPYAIKDYYDFDPDLAVNVAERMVEFDALIKRTHDNGLKLIIDFIPNHLAREYQSNAKPAGVQDLGQTDQPTIPFDPQNNFYYLPTESFQVPDGVFIPEGAAMYPTLNRPPEQRETMCLRPSPAWMTGTKRLS